MSAEDGFDLVLPFVCVTSVGGPYDDAAFVAGFHLGQIDTRLSVLELQKCVGSVEDTVRTESLPQLDLIAMHHGFVVEVVDGEPYDVEGNLAAGDPAEWTFVRIKRSPAAGSSIPGDTP